MKWKCGQCGNIVTSVPQFCPVCSATPERFVMQPGN
ncbi:MAG: rubredoxin [Candidatus Micrarchaeota archaeon]